MAVESASVPIVLVTGASGFIGTHLIQQLLASQKYRVRGTVRSLQNKERIKEIEGLVPENNAYPLDFFEGDLNREEGWKEAVQGCTYVCHVASPVPFASPRDENDVIGPAVNGTLTVLKACAEAGTVKRVVLTSSTVAVNLTDPSHESTEEDWQAEEGCNAYTKSKIRAERAAWDFVGKLEDNKKFELAVINPSFVVGPFITKTSSSASLDIIQAYLTRKIPAIAQIKAGVIDVRDVAAAHIAAMEIPDAAGHRHILNERGMWLAEIVSVMYDEFFPQGYKVPTAKMPTFLAWTMKFFNSEMKLMWPLWNHDVSYNNDRLRNVLGINPRDASKSILESCYSIIELGFVPKTSEYKGPSESSKLNNLSD